MTGVLDSARSALVDELGEGRVRSGGAADVLDGIRPGLVVSVEDTEQTAHALGACARFGLSVVPRGSGSKLDWGAPVRSADVVLDCSGADALLEHAAGDLVVRVRAGARIAEINRQVRASGQQLCIEAPSASATVGGVIATAESGPSRHHFGAVRDLLIGITVVRADGVVTISGGKVVKNVAGYDLGKLYTGSFGTLGVITEAIFRLHPLETERRWIRVAAEGAEHAAELVARVRASQAMPTAIELDRPLRGGAVEIATALDGRPSTTRERAETLAAQLNPSAEVTAEPPRWWGAHPWSAAELGLRLGAAPHRLGALLAALGEVAARHGFDVRVRGAAGLGVVHAGLAGPDDGVSALLTELRQRNGVDGGYVVVVRAPEAVRGRVDVWGAPAAGLGALFARIKDQFDPEHRLAPGRFVGGI